MTIMQIQTKRDLENIHESDPESAKLFLQAFIDGRLTFVKERELSEDEAGIEDETHRVAVAPTEKEGTTVRNQMILKEDPAAALFRIGFKTTAEANALLKSWNK